MTVQFKIQLKDITKPPVWRKVAVPADFTFLQFHNVIQIAFGWENCHLFSFQDKEWECSLRIELPEDNPIFGPDEYSEVMNASETHLSDIFNDKISKLLYIYDFGDDWTHRITLESTSEEKQQTAVCLSGKGACPPEDCGGPWGYESMKELLATAPKSEEAGELREWLGLEEDEALDVNHFDIDEINVSLKQM